MDATTDVLPTRSHTWVEPGDVSLGWLAGTRSVWDTDENERAVAWDAFRVLHDWLGGPTTMHVRTTYYRKGFALDNGSAAVLYDGVAAAAGGVMLTVRQGAFEQVAPEGLGLFRAAMKLLGRVSRLDLAGDDRASRRTPAQLYDLLPAARSRSRLASRQLTLTANGESKLTVGARMSERYLRCYVTDKRPGVVRHELELKGSAAAESAARILGGATLFDVWADQYRRLVAWPLS